MAKEGSTETGVFRLARTGGVAELTLARPEVHNAMNGAFWNELPGLIDALDESGATRALVLASTGRHFSAGMDLAVFSQGLDATSTARHREQFRRRILRLQDAFTRLEKARFPVIAAIQGGCIGGG